MHISKLPNIAIKPLIRPCPEGPAAKPAGDPFQSTSSKEFNLVGGFAAGAVGVGVPAALGAGALRSLASGQMGLGLGLALGAVGLGLSLTPASLLAAAMSDTGGKNVGLQAYALGAGASLAATALWLGA